MLFLTTTPTPSQYTTSRNLPSPPSTTKYLFLYLVSIVYFTTTTITTTTALSPTTTPASPPPLPNLSAIRGSNRYGTSNGSSIPSPTEVAHTLNVIPADPNATKAKWKRAWKVHKRLLPILHSLDSCRPADSSLNLACLWWKALAGNDVDSPVYDDGLSYDLLPRGFRYLVGSKRVNRRFYPRLHHANVELRTAFLDRTISNIISSLDAKDNNHASKTSKTKVRLVSLGAGYDVRSVKFLERGLVDLAVELDLPQVVEAKEKLLGPKRLLRRRPALSNLKMPHLIAADFNDVEAVKVILRDVLTSANGIDGEKTTEGDDSIDSSCRKWHTIFIFEGVMIYLDDGVPSSLLNVTSSVLKECNLSGSLCFADRLENVPEGDFELGKEEMKRNGWHLKTWLPKPGLARHMGYASLSTLN